MSLTDIDKIQELATKAVEQVKELTYDQAVSFVMGFIGQIYKEAQRVDGKIVIDDSEVVNLGCKKLLH